LNNKFFFPFFISLLFLFASCGSKTLPDVIEGEWQVTEVTITESVLAPSLVEHLRAEMLSTRYTFNPGGELEIKSDLIANGASGTWRLNEEKGELFIEYTVEGKNYPSTYKISLTNESTITISQDFGDDLGKMKAVLEKQESE